MAVSGGLFLLGVKGWVDDKVVYRGAASEIDKKAKDVNAEVTRFLESKGIEHDFESVRKSRRSFMTMPTSSQYFVIKWEGEELKVVENNPNIVRRLIELHQGNGPKFFNWFLILMSGGIVLALASGVLLGLTSVKMRNPTILVSVGGTLLFLILGFVI